MMISKSKLSNGFQTVVPSKVRKGYDVEPGDILEWVESEEGVLVRFRIRRSLKDITGIVSARADALELKKKVQKGRK